MCKAQKDTSNVPVFIITCVVARLTFFLKPRKHSQRLRNLCGMSIYSIPAHDMMVAYLLPEY